MTLILKCLLGALAVLVIALLSRTRSFQPRGDRARPAASLSAPGPHATMASPPPQERP